MIILSPIPPPLEGRIAIVTDVGSGMRWTRGCSARIARGRRHCLRTAKACRPGAPVAGANPQGQAMSALRPTRREPGGTVTQKPVSPGRARHSPLTPSRRECRCFGFSCSDYAGVLLIFAHWAMGAAKHPAFPAPSSLRGRRTMHHSGISCRGNAQVCRQERDYVGWVERERNPSSSQAASTVGFVVLNPPYGLGANGRPKKLN